MSAPGLDIQLIDKLGLNRNAERTCINFMGCYAAFNAIKVADNITKSVDDAVVLIVGVELCTKVVTIPETHTRVVSLTL